MIWLLRGFLPWSRASCAAGDKTDVKMRVAKRDSQARLCGASASASVSALEPEIRQYMRYVFAMSENAAPELLPEQYNVLRSLWRALLARKGYADDGQFSWCPACTAVHDTTEDPVDAAADRLAAQTRLKTPLGVPCSPVRGTVTTVSTPRCGGGAVLSPTATPASVPPRRGRAARTAGDKLDLRLHLARATRLNREAQRSSSTAAVTAAVELVL